MQPVNHVARDVARICGESVSAQVIERIPVPHNLEVLVENEDLVADICGRNAIERDDFRVAGKDGRVTVGQELSIVAEALGLGDPPSRSTGR